MTAKYDKNMVKMAAGGKGPGAWLMSNKLVPGSNINILYNWIASKPKPNPMHLAMETHKYAEIIFTLGADHQNPEYLGGVIEGYMGEDMQLTTTTTALYIPRRIPHGRVSWKEFEKPHIQMAIKFSGVIEEGPPKPGEGPKAVKQKAGENYNRYMISKPLRELTSGPKTSGRTYPPLTYINNKLVPGCNVYLEYVWIWEKPAPGPATSSHSHAYDEVVLNIGSDPQHPEELGAEIEAYLGGEKQVTDKTSAVFIPKNVPHGPLKWTKFERPHIQMSIVIGTGEAAEAMPGGQKSS
jgi:hypothetical protein